MMRVVFMGTPDFAASHLHVLVENDHNVVAVFSQKDRPRGRGMVVEETPAKKAARSIGLKVFQPQNVNDDAVIELLRSLNPDVIITVAFGKLLKKRVLELPRFGCFNVHASLLPKYRGAAPIQRALMNGEKVTGVTIFKMDEGMDSGPIALSRRLPVQEFETFGSLSSRLCTLGCQALMEFMDMLRSEEFSLFPQDHSKATTAPKISKKDRHISRFDDAHLVCNRIRAFDPAPGAFALLDGTELKLFNSGVISDSVEGVPGEIVSITKQGMLIACERGALLTKEVQLPGKKKIGPWEAKSGRLIQEHRVLGG